MLRLSRSSSKKDTLAAAEETPPLIMLEHQDVSKLVNIEQGDPLALVKPVAAEGTPSQDIQHCDSGMQLPQDTNDAEPLDKSLGSVSHLRRKDNSGSHHEMSASDKLPLIPAPSTVADDTESNDREQLPWVPFQLPESW